MAQPSPQGGVAELQGLQLHVQLLMRPLRSACVVGHALLLESAPNLILHAPPVYFLATSHCRLETEIPPFIITLHVLPSLRRSARLANKFAIAHAAPAILIPARYESLMRSGIASTTATLIKALPLLAESICKRE